MTIRMTKELTQQQWYAIINGLRYMGETYVNEHSGVNLTELADSLANDMLVEHKKEEFRETTATNADHLEDFLLRFSPTEGQVAFASQWARDHNLQEVFVAVNFPGKEDGFWVTGQKREPVLDGNGEPVFWTDRNTALIALRTGRHGNAFFRVYANGGVGSGIEYI